MRTKYLENVLKFLEYFSNNCTDCTLVYVSQDCIINIKKYCESCRQAISRLFHYRNELKQLYKWDVLNFYCLLIYYDFIDSTIALLKYQIKHPLWTPCTDNFEKHMFDSTPLSRFKTIKDSLVLYHVKALKEDVYNARVLNK